MKIVNETPPAAIRTALVVKGEEIYETVYKKEYEEIYNGQYAAIHVDSGEAFIGETLKQAYYEAVKKYPNQYFYFKRIGLPPRKSRGISRRKKS